MFVSLFSSLGQHGLVSQLDSSPHPPYVVLEGRGLENDLSILHLLKWQRQKLTFFNLRFFFLKSYKTTLLKSTFQSCKA